jgi:hypothetical protein
MGAEKTHVFLLKTGLVIYLDWSFLFLRKTSEIKTAGFRTWSKIRQFFKI